MFIVIGLVYQGFVSVLAIFSVLVSSETESFVFIVSTFLNIAFILGDWAGQFVVIIGTSFGNVLDGAVTAVACSLLDLGLFFNGRNNCFSHVARWEVSIHSAGFLVDQVVVSQSIVSFYAEQAIPLSSRTLSWTASVLRYWLVWSTSLLKFESNGCYFSKNLSFIAPSPEEASDSPSFELLTESRLFEISYSTS